MSFIPMTMPAKPVKYACSGPTGSGKTHLALALALALTKNGKVAMLDSEAGRGTLFAKLFPGILYQRLDVSFHPNRYLAVIAEACGLSVTVAAMPNVSMSGSDEMVSRIAAATTPIVDALVIDGISQAWNDQDGILDLANKAGGQFNEAWRKVGTPFQKRFMGAIIRAPIIIGCTMRSKMDYVLEEGTNKAGNKVQMPKKVGLMPEQRENVGYEFDFLFEVDMAHNVTVTKCPPIPNLSGSVWGPTQINDLGSVIVDWMTTGVVKAEEPKAESPKAEEPKVEWPANVPWMPPTSEERKEAFKRAGKYEAAVAFLSDKSKTPVDAWKALMAVEPDELLESVS